VMARDPAALQLRLLQTVVEVAAEKNSTLVMPVPVELLRFFERYAPTPPPSAQPPPPLEDTGDAELAAAEAAAEVGGPLPTPEIAEAPLPQIADASVPELDEAAIPPAPDEAAADTLANGQAEAAPDSSSASAPDGAAPPPGR
jgi:hypothetical protein